MAAFRGVFMRKNLPKCYPYFYFVRAGATIAAQGTAIFLPAACKSVFHNIYRGTTAGHREAVAGWRTREESDISGRN